MTHHWTNYSLCCCISAVLMLRMIIKQNSEIVILTLFSQCPISFYIFDNTLLCKLPEDRRSNFTQVWKVMENDIIQQPSSPGSVPWFMTTTESGSLPKLEPTFYYLLCAQTQIENKTYSNSRIYSETYKSWLCLGFHSSPRKCNQKGPNEKLVVELLRKLVCIINSALKATAHAYTHIVQTYAQQQPHTPRLYFLSWH